MGFADPSNVAALLGRTFTADEDAQASALIEAAELIITSKVTDYSTYAPMIALVSAKAVRRVFLNPGGIRQHSETLDDYTQSDTLDVSISAADIYITDEEWALLGVAARRAGSMPMTGGYA